RMSRKSGGKRRRSATTRREAGTLQPVAAHSAVALTRADLALRVLTIAGLLLTAYLTWIALGSGSAALCTEGSGCELVQGSRWSRFLGLPIAAWGLLLYVALAWVAWRPAPRLVRWRRLAR